MIFQSSQNILVVDNIPEMADFWAGVFSAFSRWGSRVLALHCATEEDEREVIRHVKNFRFSEVYVGNGPELAIRIKQASPESYVVLTCGDMTPKQRQFLKSSGYHFENLLEPSGAGGVSDVKEETDLADQRSRTAWTGPSSRWGLN
jgi:hypothetical protein